MSKLIIPRLQPKDKIKFVLTGELFGESPTSSIFEINVPPACPLISKTQILLTKEPADPTYTTNSSQQFYFAGFKKVTNHRTGFYTLRVRLVTTKNRGSLKKGDTARVITSSGLLTNLNANEYTILASGLSATQNSYVVDLEIPNAHTLGANSGTVNSSTDYIREVTVKTERKSFQISIPKEEVFDQLVNVKKVFLGITLNGVVDIPIYAYKQFDKENSSSLPKKILYNNIDIDEKTPPQYTDTLVTEYLSGPSYKKILRSDEKPNFLFYVAIARYTNTKGAWFGEWLQKNKEGRAIWGKAVLGGSK